MTPGTDLDVMSLDIGACLSLSFIPLVFLILIFLTLPGGDAETRFIPGILVNVHKAGEDRNPGVIRDVLPVCPL